MSLRRRMEILAGGPEHPFPLTARDADTLTNAMDAMIKQFQEESLRDGGEPEDPGIIDQFRELRVRLYVHAGYDEAKARRAPGR